MNEKFDIYSTERFSLLEPRFSRICKVDPVIGLIGHHHFIDEAGYLGVNISLLEALWVVKVLRKLGIVVCPVSIRYKSTGIGLAEATDVAENFILERRTKIPDLSEVQEIDGAWWLSKTAYGFFSKSEEMLRKDISPPGITFYVDRISGKVLSDTDLINAELPIMLTE